MKRRVDLNDEVALFVVSRYREMRTRFTFQILVLLNW